MNSIESRSKKSSRGFFSGGDGISDIRKLYHWGEVGGRHRENGSCHTSEILVLGGKNKREAEIAHISILIFMGKGEGRNSLKVTEKTNSILEAMLRRSLYTFTRKIKAYVSVIGLIWKWAMPLFILPIAISISRMEETLISQFLERKDTLTWYLKSSQIPLKCWQRAKNYKGGSDWHE